jgi:hypothetical protein
MGANSINMAKVSAISSVFFVIAGVLTGHIFLSSMYEKSIHKYSCFLKQRFTPLPVTGLGNMMPNTCLKSNPAKTKEKNMDRHI